jgi:signal transduction histidine kinase
MIPEEHTTRSSASGRDESAGERRSRPRLPDKYRSPAYLLRVFLLVTASIFIIEAVIHVLSTSLFSRARDTAGMFFDSFVLTVLLMPILYVALYRPLVLHIGELKAAESALRQASETLEERIHERTAELEGLNEILAQEIEGRKIVEAELRESEARLRSLSDHVLTAQEEERRWLSMELHDELGQHLAGLKLQVRAMERKLPKGDHGTEPACQEVLGQIDQIIGNVRRLYHDLSPSVLEDFGLTQALRSLADDFSGVHQLPVSVEIDDVNQIFPKKAEINVYRILQEAFTNIGKHAHAREVSVRVKRGTDMVIIQVEDDGVGFDMGKVRNGGGDGVGLSSMEERTWLLGGTLTVDSGEGEGTRLTIAIPSRREGGLS